MNNKDEKTFADLFSSSTSEEKNDEQTFSNIFKSQSKNIEEDINKNLTFDSIADAISNEEPENKVDLFFQNIENKEETKQEIINEEVNHSIFSSEEKESEEKIDKEKNSFDNIFESISSLTDELTNENITLEEENPSITQESFNISVKKETNPFFENNKQKQEETEEENKNPFFEEKESEINIFSTELKKEETENSINPFFEDKEENIIPKIELKLKEAPNQENFEIQPEKDNPFFNNKEQKDEKLKASFKEEKSETTTQEETPKSISPFFEEEKKEDTTNPFFQGQLSLVENKEHSNPINNIDISKSKHFDVKIVKKKEPAIKFIIGVFSYAIFIFLLLIGVTLLVYVLDTKIRAAKGDYSSPTFNAYVVLTGSMLPEIEVNDVVITKKVEASKLNEGDVITFASADSRFQGTIITHRIIKKNPPDGTNDYTFQTRGDNNNVADSALVPAANIYGKVILKIPKLGYLQEFLATDGGWIIVILIPCLTVISYDIVKLMKGLKRKKYKNIKVQK